MMIKGRRTETRLGATIAGYVWMAALALVLAPSCGGGGDGVCSLDDSGSCAAGQVCREGKDGALGCFCSPDANTGCEGGKLCLVGANGDPACFCAPDTEAGCATGTVCEEVPGDYPACFPPVTLGGQVFDLATKTPIAGARIVGRDVNFAALTRVSVSDADGRYTLEVPTPRTKEGELLDLSVVLRADAQDYITFPTAPRVALPIDVTKATGSPPHLESSATDIGMVGLESTAGLGTVSGKVLAKVPVGTLVVAGGAVDAGGGVTGIADVDGSYTVFNVPAGDVSVRGYKVGLQLAPATAKVAAGATVLGVDLADKGEATAVVSGSIQIVNPGMGSDTSIILAVDETFEPNAARGEAPPGLRIAPVSGAFTLTGVPDGHYVVLAAFENDFLTRDPDTSIGGTSIVHITVAGQNLSIAESFKVTGSLDVVSPDNEEVVSGTPKFVWSDDSGEKSYEVRVFDAFGNMVWEKTDVPGVSGSKTVEVDYGGPALTSGSLYQFRAVSIKNGGSALAMTEDLRGVFLYK
ncbi:Hypothetical protein A7982_09394 [Minicystis rosea]|nr:Hypothetical protein A7982_09394 [Minicystis rosea]